MPRTDARTSAGDAADLRLDPERAEQLQRVAQPVRDTFEHGAHECAAVVAQLEADERCAGVRIRVRRALAREVRLEEQALGSGRPALRFAQQVVVVAAGHAVAQPAERAGRGEHHAHRVPPARHRVTEDVHTAVCVRPVGRQRREDDSGRAEHDGERPGAIDGRHGLARVADHATATIHE